MNLHAGALLDRPPGPKYSKTLHFAELTFYGKLPKASTLGRWRASMGEDFLTALVVPPGFLRSSAGPLRFDAEVEERLAWLLEATDAVSAAALVIPTGRDVTPGQRDRDRLASLFERIPRVEGRHVVWSATGLWERHEVDTLAAQWGVLPAFDPLEHPVPEGEVVYGRVRALGTRSRISTGMLLDIVDKMGEAEHAHAFVAIESPRSFKEATVLQSVAEGGEAPDLGG